jgi:hypothetical protein
LPAACHLTKTQIQLASFEVAASTKETQKTQQLLLLLISIKTCHHHHHHHQGDLSKLLEKTPKCSDPTCTVSFLYTKKTVDPTPPTTPTN